MTKWQACTHDFAEMDTAMTADGLCPLCQAAEIERLRAALGQIAGKNDLSGVADDMVETAARNALYECELIARAALDVTEQRPVKED